MARVPIDIIATHFASGRPMQGIDLTVRERGEATEVDVYAAESGGSAVDQPLVSDSEGRYPYWVAPGSYDLFSGDDDFNPTQAWEAVSHEYLEEVAAGGVELGYAELTANPGDGTQTRSATTFADVTGLSTTVTVGVRPIVVWFQGEGFHGTAGQGTRIQIVEDGAVKKIVSIISGSANAIVNLGFSIRLNPAAGSHTYKIQLSSTNASAATILLGSAHHASIQVVEV